VSTQTIFIREPRAKKSLGTPKRLLENNIKIDLKEIVLGNVG
jgi:hypothetical protein